MKRIIHIVLCCCLLPISCIKEETATQGERRTATVQLSVDTRAVTETDGELTADEGKIHTLRVYAFVGGRLAGHYFTDNVTEDPHRFFMDIAFYTIDTQDVDFYVVANEGAMLVNGTGAAFDKNTTESELNSYSFTALPAAGELPQTGLPMYGKRQYTLNFKEISQDFNTAPGHEGHLLVSTKVELGLERPVAKLGVFAAKPHGETGVLTITGLKLLAQGTRMSNYLMPQTTETLQGIQSAGIDITLAPVTTAVDKNLTENITDEERGNIALYTPVLNTPYYPFENPCGNGGAWNVPGADNKGYVLEIKYSYDDEERTGIVYMPEMKRNNYYAVCCLMHNDGRIIVEYNVADWNGDPLGTHEIEYNYPNYVNPISPENGSVLGEGQKYPQPTVWYNADANSDAGSYTFKFEIKGPKGQIWTPTLQGALGTAGNFEIRVYQNINGARTYIDAPEMLVASNEPYYIQVKALNSANVGKEVGLGIVYERDWNPDGSALLDINGKDNDLKWEGGSAMPEIVMIEQVDIPAN